MKRGSGAFERETNESHDNADGEQWLARASYQLLTDRGEACCARHAVNEADSKKCECARRAAEQEIFQTGFGGADVAFVERGQDIKR